MSVAAVVLAAGSSQRLGRPKQSLVLGGETLIERTVRVAREAGLMPVLVVVRELDADIMVEGARVVVNAEAGEGMAASIRAGVRAAEGMGAEGVVVMSCDQVEMSAGHLQALCEDARRVAGSRYAGRVGVPAYFPQRIFAELLDLRGDLGARGLLQEAFAVRDEALAVDVDTEEDWARVVSTKSEF